MKRRNLLGLLVFCTLFFAVSLTADDLTLSLTNIKNGDTFRPGLTKTLAGINGVDLKYLRIYFNKDRAKTYVLEGTSFSKELVFPNAPTVDIKLVGFDNRGKERISNSYSLIAKYETLFEVEGVSDSQSYLMGSEISAKGKVDDDVYLVNVYLNGSLLSQADVLDSSFTFSYKVSAANVGINQLKFVALDRDGLELKTVEKFIEIRLPEPVIPPASVLEDIKNYAAKSSCASFSWADRGKAPKAYMKGMALVYARAVCNQEASSVKVVSGPPSGNVVKDVLSHYSEIFANLNMKNEGGVDTLRHVYALLIGLGMRESSGKYCCGRDMSANFSSADSAEAGTFQASYGSRRANAELAKLYAKYKENQNGCLLDVFKEGVTCKAGNEVNWGTGEGFNWQALTKQCPAFSAEWAAILVRFSGGNKGEFGPLRTYKAQVRPECDNMLLGVQKMIEANPAICKLL